jgi:hypothetical protein
MDEIKYVEGSIRYYYAVLDATFESFHKGWMTFEDVEIAFAKYMVAVRAADELALLS